MYVQRRHLFEAGMSSAEFLKGRYLGNVLPFLLFVVPAFYILNITALNS